MTLHQLDLRFESCVRSLSVWTSCTRCVEACPEQAITDDGAYKSIVVDLDQCTDCGACSAACPTDAFTAPYDVDEFVDTAEARIACGHAGLPCIGAIATEDLIAIALRLGDVTIVDEPCPHDRTHGVVAQRIEEVNAFLASIGQPGQVTLEVVERTDTPAEPIEEAPEQPARRRLFFGGAEEKPKRGTLVQPPKLDKDNLQYTQDRRWRLLSRIPATVSAAEAPLAGDALSFTSSKRFEAESCTLCTICVRICPTGALTSGRNFRDLRFDTSQCVRCGLCHEVCQTHAIHVADHISIADFLTRAPVVLDRIKSRKCTDCGMSYNAAVNVHGLCPRCASLEQEAIELSTVRR